MIKDIVSIIIPLYNGQKTIEKCFDSLKKQNYPYWKAIVVDDKSKDNSLELAKKYAEQDDRFLIIEKEKNSGVSNTRNKAIEYVDTPLCAFLDCDDMWESDYLEKMVSEMYETDSDIVQCGFVYDFENGSQVFPKTAFKKDVVLEEKKLRKVYRRMMTGINMNHVCMKLIKTELIKGLRFDENLRTAEDLVFVVQLFGKVKRYSYITDRMYHYSRSTDSITGKGLSNKEKLRCNNRAAMAALEMYKYYSSIIDKCNKYNVEVCICGIENEAQDKTIEKLGFAYKQGYYYGKPVKYDV